MDWYTKLCTQAESMYLPDRKGFYHTLPHGKRVANTLVKMARRLKEHSIVVDPDELRFLGIAHDLDSHKPLDGVWIWDLDGKRRRPHYPEEISAYRALRLHKKLGNPTHLKPEEIWESIVGSNYDQSVQSLKAKILAAADLYDVAFGSYHRFKLNSLALWREMKLLKNKPHMSREEAIRKSLQVLLHYAGRDLRITAAHDLPDGSSAWHTGLFSNLWRLIQETWPENAELCFDLSMDGALYAEKVSRSCFSPGSLYIVSTWYAQQLPRGEIINRVLGHYVKSRADKRGIEGDTPLTWILPPAIGPIPYLAGKISRLYVNGPDAMMLRTQFKHLQALLAPYGQIHVYNAECNEDYFATLAKEANFHLVEVLDTFDTQELVFAPD